MYEADPGLVASDTVATVAQLFVVIGTKVQSPIVFIVNSCYLV